MHGGEEGAPEMELDGKKQDGSAFQHTAMSPIMLQSCLKDQCCQGPLLWSLCLRFVFYCKVNLIRVLGGFAYLFCIYMVSGTDDELEVCVLYKYGVEFLCNFLRHIYSKEIDLHRRKSNFGFSA